MAIETGNFLSKQICEYIDQWTSFVEQKELAIRHDYSVELTRKLVRRERKLNDSNITLAIDLVKLAIINRKNRLLKDKKAHKEAIQNTIKNQ